MNKHLKNIPNDVVQILSEYAQSEGRTFSSLVRMLLIQEARKIEQQEKEKRRHEELVAQN